MKKCPKCEKVMSDNSAFCDMCGSSLESVEAEEEILEEVSTIPPVELLEPEILDEPETLEPEKAKSQLEERGNVQEPESSGTQQAEEIKKLEKDISELRRNQDETYYEITYKERLHKMNIIAVWTSVIPNTMTPLYVEKQCPMYMYKSNKNIHYEIIYRNL